MNVWKRRMELDQKGCKISQPLMISQLNALVEQGKLSNLIRDCETEHQAALDAITHRIMEEGSRVVFLAGPSSSGKTTSAARLVDRLRTLGKQPVTVSLDDYYIDRDHLEPDADGKLDLEHIRTIDTALFRQHLTKLLAGETVSLPHFDFTTGRRTSSVRVLALKQQSILIVEGIHGLNPLLQPAGIQKEEVFRLYVSPAWNICLSSEECVDDRDLRLLRRIIRDQRTRGTAPEKTLEMWESVGRGEQRWILPFRRSADACFNSALPYEPVFLKGRLEILEANGDNGLVGNDWFRGAAKVLGAVAGVVDDCAVPHNSILREFIGGSGVW